MKTRKLWIGTTVVCAAVVLAVGFGPAVGMAGPHRGKKGKGFAPASMLMHEKRLAKAMDKLQLSAAQRVAVESLAKDLKAKAAPMRALRVKLHKVLAEGVRAGALDKEKVSAVTAQMKAQAKDLKPAIATALNKLHATLTQEQRGELVKMVRDGRRHRAHKRPGFKMLRQLDLTDAQKDQVRDVMKAKRSERKAKRGEWKDKGRQMRAKARAAAKAFVSADFDATKLPVFSGEHRSDRRFKEGMFKMAESLLPILTQEQRQELAGLIETPPARRAR